MTDCKRSLWQQVWSWSVPHSWRWAVGLGVTIALCLPIGCGFVPSPSGAINSQPAPRVTARSIGPVAASSSARLPSLPPVDGAHLWQHITALNFERDRASNRDRARTYLTQTLTQLGWQPQLQTFEGGVNVIAQRPGTVETGGILVSAHYDTVPNSPGADDNASAIAIALEVARLLGPRATKRPLTIAFFDREEAGLAGSFAFTTNPANLTHLAGVINLEMLGYACYTVGCQTNPQGLSVQPGPDRGDFLGVVGDQEHLPLLAAFQAVKDDTLPPLIAVPIPLKGLLTPDVLRSDHAPFWANSIGAVMVSDTANFRNPHYHQPSDTPQTLDRRFLKGSAQRVVNAVTVLLDQEGSLATPP